MAVITIDNNKVYVLVEEYDRVIVKTEDATIIKCASQYQVGTTLIDAEIPAVFIRAERN